MKINKSFKTETNPSKETNHTNLQLHLHIRASKFTKFYS